MQVVLLHVPSAVLPAAHGAAPLALCQFLVQLQAHARPLAQLHRLMLPCSVSRAHLVQVSCLKHHRVSVCGPLGRQWVMGASM